MATKGCQSRCSTEMSLSPRRAPGSPGEGLAASPSGTSPAETPGAPVALCLSDSPTFTAQQSEAGASRTPHWPRCLSPHHLQPPRCQDRTLGPYPRVSFSLVTLSQPLACRPAGSTPKPELPKQEGSCPSGGTRERCQLISAGLLQHGIPAPNTSQLHLLLSIPIAPLGSGLLPGCSPNSSQRQCHTAHIT